MPPRSLKASLVARISQRSEGEKQILDTLAVAVAPIGVSALRGITKQRTKEFNLAVEQLQAQELVQTDGSTEDSTLRLAHDWVGVTVLSGVSVDEKKLIHAAIARFTESECSGSPDQWEAVSLARHWLNSDTPDLSRPYLGRAIEALVSHSLFEAAAQTRLQALRLCVDKDWASLKETLQFLHQCGELDTIQELVKQELTNPVRLCNRRRRWLYGFLGRAANLRWRWDLAIESITSALQTPDERGHPSTELLLKADLLITFSKAGREAQATRLFEELRDTTPESDEELSKRCLAYFTYFFSVTGDLDQACSCILQSLRVMGMKRLSPSLIGRLSNLRNMSITLRHFGE